MDQNLVGLAFIAGMVAAFNPCGFAMLPAYLTLVIDPRGGSQLTAVGRALAATAALLALDALLVVSCSLKFWQGGWFPLVLGAAIFTVMATWRRGRELQPRLSRVVHWQREPADVIVVRVSFLPPPPSRQRSGLQRPVESDVIFADRVNGSAATIRGNGDER